MMNYTPEYEALLSRIQELEDENKKLKSGAIKPKSTRAVFREFKVNLLNLIENQKDETEYKLTVAKALCDKLNKTIPEELISLITDTDQCLTDEDMESLIRLTLKNLFLPSKKSKSEDKENKEDEEEIETTYVKYKEPYNVFGE